MTCPHCGQAQRESSLVVSTICKGCGAYLKIERGKVINHEPPPELPRITSTVSKEQESSPETKAAPGKDASPPATKAATSSSPATASSGPTAPPANVNRSTPAKLEGLPPLPAHPKLPSPPAKRPPEASPAGTPKEERIPPQASLTAPPTEASTETKGADEPSRFRPPVPESKPAQPVITVPKALDSLLNRKERKRPVKCFECDHVHEILIDSTSALCPRCGAYIGLKDYDIRDRYNSRIQTRGNVFVHKKGSVTGITIQCHNLTIEGEIQGGAECSGDFLIRKTGKIVGPVSCDRLIVEHKAQVDFMATVTAREVTIDGNVTGNVSCKKLVLHKRATLDGDLTVSTLSIEEGARHSGRITMVGQAL